MHKNLSKFKWCQGPTFGLMFAKIWTPSPERGKYLRKPGQFGTEEHNVYRRRSLFSNYSSIQEVPLPAVIKEME